MGNKEAVSQRLKQILQQWQSLTPIPMGYLAGNILNLADRVGARSIAQRFRLFWNYRFGRHI